MNYLAFDLGASGGKLFWAGFDGTKLRLSTVYRFENAAVPLKDGLYWDFLYIWRSMCAGIQKASAEGKIDSFGIDTFSNDFSFIDRDGELLAPVRCYRDKRTKRAEKAIYATMSPWHLYRETGNQAAPFNTLMQLAAMRAEHKDSLLDTAHRLLFLPDLLAYYITGEELAEETISSVSQMYSFAHKAWSPNILDSYSIPERLFGRPTPPATVSGRATGEFCAGLGVDPFDFVSVCQHDTASAFLAVPGNGARAIISSGTWALVGCEVDKPIINEYGFAHNIANEGSLPGHHRLLRNVMGSWLLQQLREEYARAGEEYTYAQLEQLAGQAPAFAFLVDVDDEVFFAPGNMRGRIRERCVSATGKAPQTPGEYTRCICESLALKYRWAVEKLEILTDQRFPMISIIGGGARDGFTCQMTANACGRPVEAGPADASALGNVLVQMLAHEEIGSVEQGRTLLRNDFTPKYYGPKDKEQWEQVYQRFKGQFGLD